MTDEIPSLSRAFDFGTFPPELDPYLDAAESCFIKFGYERTSVPDIAKEVGKSRATVYRLVGDIERVRQMFMRRLFIRALDSVFKKIEPFRTAPETKPLPVGIVTGLEALVRSLVEHPVIEKIREDEPHLINVFELGPAKQYFTVFEERSVPMLKSGIDNGLLAEQDPTIMSQWLIRVALSLVTAPPQGDIRAYLDEIVLPFVTPETPAQLGH